MAVMTPYAMAAMAHHFYEAGKYRDKEVKTILFPYYCFCASIELATKSAILALDCTSKEKIRLKQKIGHDLIKAIEECGTKYNLSFLSDEDKKLISSVNIFYKNKGLEYFTIEMLVACMKGYKELPSIDYLEVLCKKFQTFLHENSYFIDGKTSHVPTRGILTFI